MTILPERSMMALESPLYPSPGGLMSAFSPYTDKTNSPRSPRFSIMSPESNNRLAPNHASGTTFLSPTESEMRDPSPITSSGTSGTEIEDSSEDGFDGAEPEAKSPEPPDSSSGGSVKSEFTIKSIDTAIPSRARSDSDETPLSVIHAPHGFSGFNENEGMRSPSPPRIASASPSSQRLSALRKSPTAKVEFVVDPPQKTSMSPASTPPPPISTTVKNLQNPLENATPRAQTRQEVEALELDKRRRRSSSLEDIPEADAHVTEEDEYTEEDTELGIEAQQKFDSDEEIRALNTALGECWTLCNTLAGLSSIHRERIFNFAGTGSIQEQAWKCCWKLCQKLYENRLEDQDSQVRPTLDLCRDFCQALFEVRQRDNEIADSVLRVSFELNNHLYNTHDRNLPEAFRERTLDFYITLCHRLMKQRSGLAEETDSLLRACWSLAEMLFSLRQSRREGKDPDEELLGSAVQACWELCDIFREGWTQVRPDRGTPRASQTKFASISSMPTRQSTLSSVPENTHTEPETPTTIFDDVAVSPDEAPAPNILVLGTENPRIQNRWSSSSASTLSNYSQTSQTSSTATARTTPEATEDLHLTRLKVLIVKPAMNAGFQRSGASPPLGSTTTNHQTLNVFVKSLPSNSFGSAPWQTTLLDSYKKMVLTDPALRTAPANLPSRRATASEVGRAVMWMMRAGAYPFLRDLFRLVFGFHVEEAELRKNVVIQT